MKAGRRNVRGERDSQGKRPGKFPFQFFLIRRPWVSIVCVVAIQRRSQGPLKKNCKMQGKIALPQPAGVAAEGRPLAPTVTVALMTFFLVWVLLLFFCLRREFCCFRDSRNHLDSRNNDYDLVLRS